MKANLDDPVTKHIRTDHITLDQDATIAQALEKIREHGPGDNPVYFYVVDNNQRLVGVLPIRCLLTMPLESHIRQCMRDRVVAIPAALTVMDACELFIMHRFLALPVVDKDKRLLGVVDVELLTDEMFDVQERQEADAFFETLGIRLAQLRDVTPWKFFRIRFPWMLATITSGLVCAVVAGIFELTLEKSIILAFFLTLLLGLGESVSVQTMTIMVHRLRGEKPGWGWYRNLLKKEMIGTLLLGAACAALVASFVLVWKRDPAAALTIGGGILTALVGACFVGVSVPTLLHVLKLDLKIAAGPVTLATVDLWTIISYLSLATLVLGH